MSPVGSDGGLAKVTYLPGVVPPSESDPGKSGGKRRQEPGDRAHRVSLHGLTRRNLSRWELDRLLRSRELDEEVIAAELARLEQLGLIDDQALAETLVRTRHERKGLSRSALAAELRTRHIDQEYIDAALAGLDAGDERAKALELALKRAPQLRSLDRQTAVRRLSGYLQRKGYSSEVVRSTVDEALAGGTGTVRFS